VPPALPPRDPARPPAAPPESADPALLVEIDLLRRSVARLGAELAGLRRAMESRALIDQAKGAVRALTGASDDESFALLSARSQHQNRKLVAVAADVLAAVDVAPERHRAVATVLRLGDATAAPPVPGDADSTTTWQPRRRHDRTMTAVTDPRQLVAIADLAEQLSAAGSRDRVVEVLVGPGAAALGAFGASFASRDGTGHAVAERPGPAHEQAEEGEHLGQLDGLHLGDGAELPLDTAHPAAEALRTGRVLALSRAELALRYPSHPKPPRLQGLVAIPLATDTVGGSVWTLYYDHHLPTDRGTRAMLDWAARLATTALHRAP
jgi:hypothetical protein